MFKASELDEDLGQYLLRAFEAEILIFDFEIMLI